MIHLKSIHDFLNEGKVPKAERIDIYRDERFVVVAPLTVKAAAKYGAFTHWCTSALGNDFIWDIGSRPNHPESKALLIYIIDKQGITPENDEQANKFYYMHNDFENGELEEDDEEVFHELRMDDLSYDMSKIALEVNKESGRINVWSGNNVNVTDERNIFLWDLGLNDDMVNAIEKYINTNQ